MQQKGPVVRINRQIRGVPRVRLIGPESEQIGIVTIEEAFKYAEERELDLVEVSPNAQPPVCRVMDYGKFKYQQSKRTHEAKKRQTVIKVKELKLRPKTDEHDIEFKIQQARRFLGEGKKVKFTMVYRGREITHTEIGRAIMDRVVAALTESAVIEQAARFEGRAMFLILASHGGKRRAPAPPAGESAKRPASPGGEAGGMGGSRAVAPAGEAQSTAASAPVEGSQGEASQGSNAAPATGGQGPGSDPGA